MPKPAPPTILAVPPEICTPRSERARTLFSDDNLDLLAHLLDDWFRIPGTSIRFGLDGLIGLVPGLGDILAGLASTVLIVAAWVRGVPYITLIRMVANLGIGVVVGAVPFLGDAFDIAWKANRRNYDLMVRRLQEPRRQTWRDWLYLWLIGCMLVTILMAPLVMLLWLLAWLRHHV
jgi:hypothetical protein